MTCSSKKVFRLAIVLAVTGMVLTGCTSADSQLLDNSSQSGQDTSAQQNSDSTPASDQSQASDNSGNTDSQADRGDIITYDELNQSGDDPVPSDSGDAAGENDASSDLEIDLSSQDTGETSAAPVSDGTVSSGNNSSVSSDSGYDANGSSGQLSGVDQFTGSFTKDDESESVTLVMENDTVLSFAFSVCGISGTANVTGSSAVYHGDDDYTITFAIAGDDLDVIVGGDDADQSPINGTYLRVDPDEETE